jgi:hypothetical protein
MNAPASSRISRRKLLMAGTGSLGGLVLSGWDRLSLAPCFV